MLKLCTLQISFHGGSRSFSPSRKTFEIRCLAEDRVVLGLSSGVHAHGVSLKAQVSKLSYSSFVDSIEKSSSTEPTSIFSCPNVFDGLECRSTDKFVDSSGLSGTEEKLVDYMDQLTENANILSGAPNLETISTTDIIPDNPNSVSDSFGVDNGSLSSLKTNAGDLFSGINESIGSSVDKGQSAVKTSLDTITSSITSAINSATDAVDTAVSKVFSSVDQAGELANDRVVSFSNDLKEATSKVGATAIDVLRDGIVLVEDSLANGASFAAYSYGSAKELLPTEIRNVVNLSEEKVLEILRPAGAALQQFYVAVEGLERNLGLDPSDPIVPFVLFLGTSATLWVFYWRLTYGGYSGDISPQLTLELLKGKENVDLRERDGIPDLRRAARFRYASVTLPEFNSSVRKLLKSGRDLDDSLIAAVIRNLKIVQDRSKVIVLDADGSRSKGIARSLRKLGRPYLVQGGFQSWVKQGFSVKELKPETTLTILNEEAEAIIEDINPTPVKLLGYGVGLIAAVYASIEWEKTLQFIGIFGLGQTIYRRVAAYEGPEDFKQDVRLLLTPVRLGAQAYSWAAGKLESNGIGLPTSPSSLDVQTGYCRQLQNMNLSPPTLKKHKTHFQIQRVLLLRV
ncbi:hypothetical protein CK203_086421 [Vitis vinifera]|uniref:Rhodanese domain-containing protein n=1 Tax=Vitis vinifera TaxID=29760 RepID=A0A438BSQ3_VITVI|nr:hypothetical protein CK203_086421 [Vitis vinifera]